MRERNRKILLGVGATALVLGGVAGVAGIASADPSAKAVDIVDGFGDVNDDFNDHEREAGVLCDGCDNSNDTDLVTLWQSILVADGYLPIDEADGDFGKVTTKATTAWQEDNELDGTGEVDQATWATADDFLELADDGYSVTYPGDVDGVITMERDPDEGEYMLFDVSDTEGTMYVPSAMDGHIWLFEETFTLEPAE